MNFFYVLITAITVSLDSYVCGLSLSIKHERKAKIIFGISLVVFAMCLCAGLLGKALSPFLNDTSEPLSGTILIFVALCEYFSQENDENEKSKNLFKTSLTVGFAIGLDGACACLSLSVSTPFPFTLALIFTAFHVIFITLSFITAKNKFLKRIAENKNIAPMILACLGAYKILSCFNGFL